MLFDPLFANIAYPLAVVIVTFISIHWHEQINDAVNNASANARYVASTKWAIMYFIDHQLFFQRLSSF